MPRRLLRLELHGYKTFAGRTEFEFGNITCIIGPNGSGKSNIADSLRCMCAASLRWQRCASRLPAGSRLLPPAILWER